LSEVSLLVFIIILDRSETFYLTVFAKEDVTNKNQKLTHIEYISKQMSIVTVEHTIHTNHSVACFTKIGNRFIWVFRTAHYVRQLLIQLRFSLSFVALRAKQRQKLVVRFKVFRYVKLLDF